MGSILSRRIAGVEDIDIQANSAYRYPPKCGEWRTRAPTAWRPAGRARRAGGGALLAGVGWELYWVPGLACRLPAWCSARPRPGPRGVCGALDGPPRPGWVTLGQSRRPEGLGSRSAHWGDPRGPARARMRFRARRCLGVSTVPGASLMLTKWSLS